jgi:putative endopeptidase
VTFLALLRDNLKRSRMRVHTTLSLLILCFAATLLSAQENAGKTLEALNPKFMDTTADPCVNFYQYACGGYLKQTPIPQDESS